ncbi:hypothetical protein N7478_002127 [Penicillium angulare]|uniref:uncharacterized protein n=1 Tax=Penicillium angulare TaxID=116970 RepID=UPI0025406C39|nr:uncharacterized protein N7478_002127 [Penicillium angulare]KAJ5289097.1 hypothetical protein N7478_002127 [Penicillium angulare]
MKIISSILLFSATALAHPKGLWWGTDYCYPSPDNTDNSCSPSQHTGFDWSELANGDNWSFEGFNFNGFSAKEGCRASGGKCIEGKLSQDDNWAIQIDAEQAPFSVRNFHLSTSRKADVIITYGLADGSSCHQVASVSPGGSDVTNDQCGGAVSVQFQLAAFDQYGDVDLELNQIGFDCGAGPKPPGPLVASPSHSHPGNTMSTPAAEWTPTSSIPVHISTPTTNPPVMTTSTVWSTVVSTVTKCHSTVTDCPAHSTVLTTFTTSSTTVCPVEPTVTEPVKSSPQTIAPPAETTSTVTIPTIPGPPETPPCPAIVPKCLNTWLDIPHCTSNSDAACFCPSNEFTAKFKSCVHAWSSSQEETDSALSYFAGICASYIPKNPDIISLVPTSTPASTPLHPTKPYVSGPVETIAPTTSVPEPPCTTVTWSSITATVPRVGFSTSTGPSTTVVGLVTGAGTPGGWTSATSVSTVTSVIAVPASSPTCKSSFTTVITMTSTGCACDASTSATATGAQPTSSVINSNSGSRAFAGSLWALGVACFVIALF